MASELDIGEPLSGSEPCGGCGATQVVVEVSLDEMTISLCEVCKRSIGAWQPPHPKATIEDLEALLSELYLYVSWRECTRHLTTQQREWWLDILKRTSTDGAPYNELRWWA